MRINRWIIFLGCCCLAIIVAGAFYYSHRYQLLLKNNLTTIANTADTQLDYNQQHYDRAKKQTRSIVTLMSHDPTVYDYVFEPNAENEEHLRSAFSAIMTSLEWYHQIRFIDSDGNEKIKVESPSDDMQVSRHSAKLANIRDSSLFEFLKSIPDQTVKAWGIQWSEPLSLSSQPREAIYYVAIPVTLLGQRHGYIVLDVSLSTLYQMLILPQKGFHLEMLNQDGQYIAGVKPSQINLQQQNWSSERFNTLYPKSWEVMQHASKGVLTENNHLIIYRHARISSSESLTMLINLSPQQLQHEIQRDVDDLKNEAYFVLLIMLLFALPAATLGLHYHQRNIESKLANAALHGMSAVVISDTQYRIKLVNKTFEKTIHVKGAEVEGLNTLDFLLSEYDEEFKLQVKRIVQEHALWRGEINYVAPNGELMVVLMRIQAVLERGRVSYYIISLVDISERKALENRLREMSEMDDMTKLWNRRKFEMEMKIQSAFVREHVGYTAVLVLLDIDYFKSVNDQHGHDEGDRVIIHIASSLKSLVRNTDFVARIGGEEFAIIMPNTVVEDAIKVMDRIRQDIAQDELAKVTISTGITDMTEDRTQTYKWADVALYSAKSEGRNRISTCLSSEEIA